MFQSDNWRVTEMKQHTAPCAAQVEETQLDTNALYFARGEKGVITPT